MPGRPNKKDTKICPYCAEEIKVEAIKCRYCQSDLTDSHKMGINNKEQEINQFGCGSVILALLLPVVGIITGIIWLTFEEDKERAWPMIGVSLLGIFLWVIIF